MKKIWLSFFVGLFMVVLAACGGEAETRKAEKPAKQDQQDVEAENLENDFEAFKKQRKQDYQTQ